MQGDFSKKRIFVQIASYRDPQCHPTIRDLFTKASHPERVFVGVCWQYDPELDADCFSEDYPRKEQVRVLQYHVRDAQGAGWARNEAQSLWQGEEYTLQIQAHMRFEEGWDETLIAMLEALPTEKALLTAWLPGYTPPDNLQPLKNQLPVAVVNRLGSGQDAQMVHFIKRMVPLRDIPDAPMLTCSWIGNFMFARSSIFKEVPFDPYIYFWGEEINYSARLWTHGYDMYHLNKVVLYHYWDRKEAKDAGEYRDHLSLMNQRSLMRNLHVLGFRSATDEQALKDIEKYMLGTERTLAAYWKFAGINLIEGVIAPHAREGKWGASLKPPKDLPKIFVTIASYRDPECRYTLMDMFRHATYPDRIQVGLCLQLDPVGDKHCLVASDRENQIRRIEVHYRESGGANWARAQAMSLMQDEEYVLQIDSHMRFEPGWDETLIDALARCPSDKPVISTYLPNYDPPDRRAQHPDTLLRIRVRKFGEENDPQLIHITGAFVHKDETERYGLYPCPFYAANFMFTRADTVREVPIDPHIHFYGDEITYAARLWTHGYDIFQLDQVVLYHYWVRRETLHLQHYRNTATEKSRRSLLRVRHLLGFGEAGDKSALAEMDTYGLGTKRALEDLWEFAGVDWQRHELSQNAKEGIWNLEARQKAIEGKKKKLTKAKVKPAKKNQANDKPRIFVQIACYRDPDLQYTVKDLFEKAAHPDRISVGICWQFVKDEDTECFRIPYPRPEQVRVHEIDARESKGVCWARSLTQKMWDGEEFTLQIDSHMRFEEGWDDLLCEMWEQCGSDKAVLTCYPPSFTPPNRRIRTHISGMGAKEFNKDGILLMTSFPTYSTKEPLPEKPMRGAFASACMLFGPATIIEDVPYDPNIYFFGEEISLAVRLWTHGYDLYHPNRLCIYHDWKRDRREHTHFSDHKDWRERNERSFARVRHMLGTEISTYPEIIKDMDIYGLGKERTLEEYQEFSGVDFVSQTFTQKATGGNFSADNASKVTNGHFAIGRSNGGDDARIFVQIASYRDPECQHTVKDLFDKAKNPDRLQVGICWQFDPKEDEHCFQVSTRPEQVRMLPYDWREGEGVCWARHQTQQLWDGEEYTLQIDSHMRFMPGWDELMILELAACEADKPVISCSPAAYTPPYNLQPDPKPTIRRVQQFFPDGNIRGKGEYIDRSPEKPLNGAFIAAGFVFSRADIIPDVPYDPYLYFDQEEIVYAARLYTHGWDVFSSRKPLLYHYYNTDPKGSVRPLHWRDALGDNEKRIRFLRNRGMNRFNHIVGHRFSSEPQVTRDLMKYSMGRARTFQQFEEYSGIDFKNKIASERAIRCLFIKDLEKYRDAPIFAPEVDSKPVANRGMPVRPAAQAKPPAPMQPRQLPRQSQTPAADSMARPERSAPMLSRMLEPGDYAPFFELQDTTGKMRGLEVQGGKHCMLVFLPARNIDYVAAFFQHMHQQLTQQERMDFWQLYILDDTMENLKVLVDKLKFPIPVWADPERKVAKAFGLLRPDGQGYPPAGFLLNNNLKIVRRHINLAPAQLAAALANDCANEMQVFKRKQKNIPVLSEVAPVLIVPDAFTPEFCDRCIKAFRTGHTFKGTVGAEHKLALRTDSKLRTDYIVHGDLLDEIDEKLSRSLFPEIQKVFGFEVTHRELYKVGLYTGEEGGFFRQHRDNFEPALAYRRIAMTLHLSDDYEGGGLTFPEYGKQVYRPAKGSAIAFSCSSMHEALPVTRGERFILVGFMHGDEEEAFRRHYLASKGSPLKIEEYTPKLRTYESLPMSRDFYKNWRDEHVNFNKNETPAKAETTKEVPMSAKPEIKPGGILIPSIGGHQPRKVFESPQAIVLDDFLPEDVYRKIQEYVLKADFEYLNTKGKVSRAWHVHDGFPMRSVKNAFYYAHDNTDKPEGGYVYPTQTHMDLFMDNLLAIQPHVEHLTGKEGGEGWNHVSANCWMYPPGTGLSMHDDGSGVYTGAYVYFLNPVWRSHWGGLLIMMDEAANQTVYEHRRQSNELDFYKLKYFHSSGLEEMLMEQGLGKCIFPVGNRMVFIANNAYHMVTRVNETAGDNIRMSIAGFFSRKKKKT